MNIPPMVLDVLRGGKLRMIDTEYEVEREREDVPPPPVDGYQVGAILENQWGYEQTNIDYYRIVKRSGKWVTIEKIAKEHGPEEGFMSAKCWPANPVRPVGKPFRRMLRFDGVNVPSGFSINGYSGGGWCRLWDGKPGSYSWYG